MPKLSQRADLAFAAVVRMFLIGAVVHLGMIVAGFLAATMDGPTNVGFPWVFAHWGSVCFGNCSWFRADMLVATSLFWIGLAFAWAWLRLRAKGRIFPDPVDPLHTIRADLQKPSDT